MNLTDTPHLLALAAALGWASGLRLYAVLFITGAAGYLGWMPLPEGLRILQNPLVLAVTGALFAVEFLADKIAWIDSVWDAVHTFIRIPAGAALAAAAMGADGEVSAWLMALLGGTLAATAHATKMTTRAAVNTSPEPFSNVAVSLLEDGLVVAWLWLANTHPLLFAAVLALCVIAALALLLWLWRFLRAVLRRTTQLLTGVNRPDPISR